MGHCGSCAPPIFLTFNFFFPNCIMPIYIGSASVRLYYVNWFILFWENSFFFFLSIATCIIFHSISLPWHLFYYHILVMQSLGMLQLSKYEEKKCGGKPKISKNLILDEYVYLCQQFSYLNLHSRATMR